MRKSNYIAAAMVFAALVGCQKELVPVSSSEQAASADLNQRPVLANTTLTFGGAETRVTLGGTSGLATYWEVGDAVGAMIVDDINPSAVTLYYYDEESETYKSQDWEYSDYLKGVKGGVSFADTYLDEKGEKKSTSEVFYVVGNDKTWTNYPYTTKDKVNFETEATLVEGHYMFYAPYNANNGTRGPLVVTLPVNQKVSSDKKEGQDSASDAVEALQNGEYNTPSGLVMHYLTDNGEGQSTRAISTTLGHIFAYPQIKIVNNYNGYFFNATNKVALNTKKTATMTVKWIDFYAGDNEDNILAYKRNIRPVDLQEVNDWVYDKANKDHKYVTTFIDEVSDVLEETYQDEDFTAANTTAFEGTAVADKSVPAQRVRVTLNRTLAPGEDYTFNAVLPGADYTKAGLYARILVSVVENGKEVDYYIMTDDVNASGNYYYDDEKSTIINEIKTGTTAGAYLQSTSGALNGGDYRFVDRFNDHNKSQASEVILVRGQRWPASEMDANKNAKTGITGHLMTINLKGGVQQAAIAAAVEKEEAPSQDTGIKTTDELIELIRSLDRDANVMQVEKQVDANKDNALFKLHKDNTVTITAELIEAIKTSIPNGSFTLIDNLPIDENILVSGSGKSYTFTADVKCTINYTTAVDAYDAQNKKLGSGINRVSGDVTVAMADKAKGAVVFVDGGNVTVKNAARINGIVVDSNATLTVNSTADVAAWIKADNVVLVKGNLVNGLNVLGTVENNNLQTIKGETNVVTYVTKAGFDTNAIAAATQVNYVTVFVSKDDTVLPVTPTSFDFIKNLKNVTVMFDSKVAGLVSGMESVNGITLTNIKQMKAPKAIEWGTDKNFLGIVNVYCDENADLEKPFYVNITPADKSVKFNAPEGMEEDTFVGSQAFNAAQLQNQLNDGSAVLGSDITVTAEAKGSAAATMTAGAILDGNGHTLSSTGNYGVLASAGGTIKGLTIEAESANPYDGTNTPYDAKNNPTGYWNSRAIFASGLEADLTIEDCVLKGGYAMNVSGGKGNVTVKETTLYGWTSFSTTGTVKFEGCTFKVANYFTKENTDKNELVDNSGSSYAKAWNQKNESDYIHLHNATIRPYGDNVTFEDCEFSADMVFDFSEVTGKVNFVNCKIGGQPLESIYNFNGSTKPAFDKLLSDKGAVFGKSGTSGFGNYLIVTYEK